MMRRPFLTRYRQAKRDVEIETATTDMLDPYLINSKDRFKGDYGMRYPDMIENMNYSNSLRKFSKPVCTCDPKKTIKCQKNGIFYSGGTK